eukprot:333893_1
MDDLRSLEGLVLLQQKKSKVKQKPKINRANSVLPNTKTKGLLDVIKSSETVDFFSRSYSSRADTAAKAAESLQSPKSKNDPKKQPEKQGKNEPNPLHCILSTETDDVNNNITEEYADASKYLSIENYDSNELVSNVSLRALGLGSIGLNISEIENTYDENEEDNYEFENDNNWIINKDEYNDVNDDIKENIDEDILNINRFPIEEFKNYPSSSSTGQTKDNATKYCIIGMGSFGIVLKSFHLKSCQTVAIKECRISDDKKLLQLFVSEANFYKEFINNKYIIDILGFGRNEINNKLCIALEYMDLQSLFKHINYKLEEVQLKYICFSILSALENIHKFKICHNDIKPDNILINSYGQCKLSDFGCCIKMNNNNIIDTICGSKQYYSPEKWLISPPQYNTKSDIFSFGITFYELITLTMDNNREFGYYEPPNIDNLSQKYSNILCNFLSKMLIWDYKERWNAKQLLNHQFLTPVAKIKPKPFVKKLPKKEKDLQFMIESLVEHYSSKTWLDTDKNTKNIEKQYNDNEKIDNLCKHSGCTEKEITTMIKFKVGKVKQQYSNH